MKNLAERSRAAFKPSANGFNALNHGDLWTANILFKHLDGQAKVPVKLIDFQFSCWSSPVIDLHFLLNTSTCHAVHVNHMYELVKYYHSHLANALQQLHYVEHIPTQDEFMDEYNARLIIGELGSESDVYAYDVTSLTYSSSVWICPR